MKSKENFEYCDFFRRYEPAIVCLLNIIQDARLTPRYFFRPALLKMRLNGKQKKSPCLTRNYKFFSNKRQFLLEHVFVKHILFSMHSVKILVPPSFQQRRCLELTNHDLIE